MALMRRFLVSKFRADVRALNQGDYGPLLAGYADGAVLRFNEGPHRFAGEKRGRDEIEVFLRNFTEAGLQGEVVEVWTNGPPWKLRIVARFKDRACGRDGEEIYSNEVMLYLRTRWGKIVEHEDFYVDTARLEQFEQRLTELGIDPVTG